MIYTYKLHALFILTMYIEITMGLIFLVVNKSSYG
jgi:hypothetical protein